MKIKKSFLSLFIMIIMPLSVFKAQSQDIESPLLIFNRGELWQSMYLGKHGPSSFSDWRRLGIGLDWPGFDPTWVRENLGGSPSYLATGGFWVGAKKMNDSVLTVEDWSIYGGSISADPIAKYIVTRHRKYENHVFQDGTDLGEEYIKTVWEYNHLYQNEFDLERQLPIRVTRYSHQWNGSERDQNYIIHEYIFKNISNELRTLYPNRAITDSLKDFYLLLNYGIHANSRSWTILFPTEKSGARNTWFFPDPARKMIYGRAATYLGNSEGKGEFGFSPSRGPIIDGRQTGEWLAPGYVGFMLLYSSKNKNNRETYINKLGWSAGDNLQDLIGPMDGKGTAEARYEVLQNPSLAANPVSSPLDTLFMRRNRMWSMMSLGPWNFYPGDSIKVVFAELVDGADYKYAIDAGALSAIGSLGLKIFQESADKAKFTFDNNFNHPDPPQAPDFTVDFNRDNEEQLAIVISWDDTKESIPDPDDGLNDLVKYKIYRSNYLPIGPWDSVATISKGDPAFYEPGTGVYKFLDTTVSIGASYYYALTALDSGRTFWNINPAARMPDTRSIRVPVLESSIFSNRKTSPFTATIAPVDNVNNIFVVPNPFIIGEGYSLPGDQDRIQFVNIPNPCTIRIFNVRGDLVKTLEVDAGSGAIAEWDQVTDFGQFVVSGVYIYHVESPFGKFIGKFSIIR